MKVAKDFYCIIEKKKYIKGSEYTGTRKDLGHLLEVEINEIEVKEPKVIKAKKNKKYWHI